MIAIYLPDQDEISRDTLIEAREQFDSVKRETDTALIKQAIKASAVLTLEVKNALLKELDEKATDTVETLEKAWGASYDELDELVYDTGTGQKLVRKGYFEDEVEAYYTDGLSEQCFSEQWGFSRESFRNALLSNVDWPGVARDLADGEEYDIRGTTFYVVEE